ncbi:MAG TPA: hypothetical protein VJX92_15715 [Methylomirabilota bacterium]|nr:hypothetical protein [Methylomirabilota bacterium]
MAILFGALFIPIAGLAVFWLPFRFPPTGNIVSSSLVFGFNNAVAIAAVVVLAGLVTVFHLWRRSRAPRDTVVVPRWFFPGDEIPGSARVRWTVVALMAGAHALLIAVMWIGTRQSNAWRIDFEASHFLWRLQLMELFGARPYVDFQHEYGPALLYVPIFVHRLLAPAAVGLEAAYYLSCLGGSLLGLVVILAIIERVPIARPYKEVTFCLVAAAGLVPYMGLNGNLIRYVPPYLSLLVTDRATGRTHGPVRGPVAVAAIGVVNILISPDVGLAFGLGWAAHCLVTALTDRSRAIAGLAGLLVAGAFGALVMPREYVGSVLSFSAGANNFPLVPAAHIVVYLATVFLTVPALFADALSGRSREPALLFAMATTCVVTIPGALGRADPPHVLFFGLGISLLLLVRAAMHSHRGFGVCALVYVLVVVGGTHVSNARAFYGATLRSLHPRSILAFVRPQEPEMTDAQRERLKAYPPLGLPFCSYGTDRRTMADLWSRRQIEPEYYCGIIGVYSEVQLSRKIADTTQHEFLLVRKAWLGQSTDPCRRHVAIIQSSFIYPGRLSCRRDALETDIAVIRAIIAHYQVVEEVGPYVVMRRAGRG